MKIVKYILTLLGLAMLVGAYFLYSGTQRFLETAVSTQGTVIDLRRSRSSDSDTYAPVVEFNTSDGALIEFTSSTSSNPPSYTKGETVEVLYQEASPYNAKIKSFFSLWGAAAIVGGLGSIFFLIGFSIIFFGVKRSKMVEHLKKSGTRVNAEFQSVQLNTSLSVNGRHPYQILAQWQNPTTSEIHLFNSDNLWFDPTDHIKTDVIEVLIDTQNPKEYYVDTSFLPKLAS